MVLQRNPIPTIYVSPISKTRPRCPQEVRTSGPGEETSCPGCDDESSIYKNMQQQCSAQDI